MHNIRGVVFGAALVACASGDDVTRTSSAVSGGTVDTTDSGVVTLLVSQNSQLTSMCSAVVVSPHVVVTAAHCINTSGDTYQVAFGNDYQNATSTIAVSEVHFDPAFDGNPTNGHDLGVAILSATAPVAPVAMNKTALVNPSGQAIRFVGFGVTKTNSNNSLRQQTTSSVQSVDANNIYVSDTAHNTCAGDSGGAAFMTFGSTELLAGVVAQGDATCANNSISVRVDAEASFIQTYINLADPGATDAGADAAPVIDASSNDAAGSNDAAPSSDANAPNHDGGTTNQGGGGCNVGRGESSGAFAIAAMLLAFVSRRRRFA